MCFFNNRDSREFFVVFFPGIDSSNYDNDFGNNNFSNKIYPKVSESNFSCTVLSHNEDYMAPHPVLKKKFFN